MGLDMGVDSHVWAYGYLAVRWLLHLAGLGMVLGFVAVIAEIRQCWYGVMCAECPKRRGKVS